MRTALLTLMLVLIASAEAVAGDPFRRIANSLDAHPSLRRESVPMAWLARIATRAVQPEGIHDLRMARFEGTGDTSRATLAAVDAAERSGYSRVLRVRERDGSSAFILARERPGDLVQMIILSQEPNETVLLELLLSEEKFLDQVASRSNSD